MKTAMFKFAFISALSSASFAVSAHEAVGTLSANASAIDVYHTSCFTWAASAVQPGGAAPGESPTAAKRFIGQVHKQCTTNNAACNAPAGTVKISLGSPFGEKTAAGATPNGVASTTNTTGSGAVNVDTGLWLSGAGSTWLQIADLLGADANGTYTFAITHDNATAIGYQASVHCENATLGSAVPGLNPSQHTGTGVAGSAATGWPDVANGATSTAADFNLFIHQ
jgi:hypothetical protein